MSSKRRPVDSESESESAKSDSESGSDEVETVKQPPSKKVKAAPAKKAHPDSESESDEAEPVKRPLSKKSKTEAAPAKKGASKSSSGVKMEDGSTGFELGNNRFVTVRKFKGKPYVDLREFYMTASGERKPGKKGISLNAENWDTVKGLIKDIDEAFKSL